MWPFSNRESGEEDKTDPRWEEFEQERQSYFEWAEEYFPLSSEVKLGGVIGIVMYHRKYYMVGYFPMTLYKVGVYFPATGHTQDFTPNQLGHSIKTPVEPY